MVEFCYNVKKFHLKNRVLQCNVKIRSKAENLREELKGGNINKIIYEDDRVYNASSLKGKSCWLTVKMKLNFEGRNLK